MKLLSKISSLLVMSLFAITCVAHAGADKIPQSLLKSPPSEHSGLKVFGKHALKLSEQIPALEGYQLRVRSVTMEPGGLVKNHGHETRPGSFYVIKGNVIDVQGDKQQKMGPGDLIVEDHDTEHWVINNSKEEALLFVLDIVPVE